MGKKQECVVKINKWKDKRQATEKPTIIQHQLSQSKQKPKESKRHKGFNKSQNQH